MEIQSQNINELIAALSKAQGEMSSATKDSVNSFYNSKYADISKVWAACRKVLSTHGLAVVQTMATIDGQQGLMTTLAHSSGQWMRSFIVINIRVPNPPEKDKYGKDRKFNEVHALGSAMTYFRRYALSAIVGIVTEEDDDGNSASTQSDEMVVSVKQPNVPASEDLYELTEKQAAEVHSILEADPETKKKVQAKMKEYNYKTYREIPKTYYNRIIESHNQKKAVA